MSALRRIADRALHHGVAGSARIVASRLRPSPRYDAVHVWYELVLDGERPHRALAPEFSLREASDGDLGLLDQLPRDPAVTPMDASTARARMADGGTLWIVTEGDRLAFACWIFRDRTPVWAARGGQLPLPPDVVCLEDSHASPDFRGRGVAPATWSGLADHYGRAGLRALVTKVAEDNTASRRAVEKAGFREVATMHVHKQGWRTRLRVALLADDPSHRWLTSIERSR